MSELSIYRLDGPYSWLVFLAIVLSNTVCVGQLFGTVGLMTSDYQRVVKVSYIHASLLGSVAIGVFLFSVPIHSISIKVIGCRPVSLIGCLLYLLGFCCSAFSTEFWHVLVSYSIIAALGISMNLMSTIAIVPHYFKKRSNMAYMATSLGSGVALAIFPHIYSSLRSSLSFRDSLLYMLPIVAFSASAPLVFKSQLPPTPVGSASKLLSSYIHPFKKYITSFYLINTFCWNASHVGVSVLMFSHIKELFDYSTATKVQSVFGISEAVGGVGLTLLLSKVKVNHFLLHIGCNAVAGTACIVMAIFDSVYIQYGGSVIVGFTHAITIGNMGCVCSHFYPRADVEYAFGFQEAMGGLAGILGPLTTTLLQEKYGLQSGFYLLGGQLLLGAAILLIAIAGRRSIILPYNNGDSDTQSGSLDCESEKTEKSDSMTNISSISLELNKSDSKISYTDAKPFQGVTSND